MKLLVITQKVDKEDENLGFFHNWVEEFSKHFTHVTVIANSSGSYSFPQNVDVISLGKEKGAHRIRRMYRYWEIFSYHYAHSDGVFFHMIPEFVLLAAPFLLSSKKISVLWYVHKSVTRKLKFAERLVDWIFTASELSFRLPSKKVVYSGHAIDTKAFPSVAGTRSPVLRMLSLGRISPVKDYETIIKACAILKTEWPEQWTLSIVGGPLMPRDHEYLATLKKLVVSHGLERQVVFQGSRPHTDIPEMYKDHDLFISMSTTGSIDKAVLEAMSSGLTVITANEAFGSMLSSPYFVERRSPELLAERIKMLARENRPNMQLRGLVVEGHSLEKTIKKISRVFVSSR